MLKPNQILPTPADWGWQRTANSTWQSVQLKCIMNWLSVVVHWTRGGGVLQIQEAEFARYHKWDDNCGFDWVTKLMHQLYIMLKDFYVSIMSILWPISWFCVLSGYFLICNNNDANLYAFTVNTTIMFATASTIYHKRTLRKTHTFDYRMMMMKILKLGSHNTKDYRQLKVFPSSVKKKHVWFKTKINGFWKYKFCFSW